MQRKHEVSKKEAFRSKIKANKRINIDKWRDEQQKQKNLEVWLKND